MPIIQQELIKYNFRARGTKPKYIVIHYFGSLGTAKSVANYFNCDGVQASAHYIVDDGNIIYQCVKDTDTAWHCGANKYVHPECRNSNSIGIEMQPHKLNTSRIGAGDIDWYFNTQAVQNTVWLVKKLMKKYNIPIKNVIRHYDVTGKYCPRPFVGNDINQYYKTSGNIQWQKFLQMLKNDVQNDEGDDMDVKRFSELMTEYRKSLQTNKCGDWSEEDRKWAIDIGLINGNGTTINGEPNYMWPDTLTREQAVALMHRLAEYIQNK